MASCNAFGSTGITIIEGELPSGRTLYWKSVGLDGTGLAVGLITGLIAGQPAASSYNKPAPGLNFFVEAYTTPDFSDTPARLAVSWMLKKNNPPSCVALGLQYQCPTFTNPASSTTTAATCDLSKQFTDPDGDPLTYKMLAGGFPGGSGLNLDPNSGIISGTPTQADYQMASRVYVAATDPGGLSSPACSIEWSLLNPTPGPTAVPTQAPTPGPTPAPTRAPTKSNQFGTLPPAIAVCGTVFSFDTSKYFVDNSGLPPTYDMKGYGFGSGFSINKQTGLISGIPNPVDASASPLMLTVINNGASSPLAIRVDKIPSVTAVGSPPPTTVTAGQVVTQDVSQFFTAGLNKYTLLNSLLNSPPSRNFAITPQGVISGRPDLGDVAVSPLSIVVQADNSAQCGGGTAKQTFSVIVVDYNLPPVWASNQPPDQKYCLGQRYQLPLGFWATDPEGTQATFAVTGLPSQSGLSFDPTNKVIWGVVSEFDVANGPYNVTAIATDETGRSSQNKMVMGFASGRMPPTVDPPIPSPVTAFTGKKFMGYFNYHFHDYNNNPLIYSVHGLPIGSGLGIGPITGIFSGTPNEADLRSSPIPISVYATNEYVGSSQYACSGTTGRARADFMLVVENQLNAPICLPIPVDTRSPCVGDYYARDLSRYFSDPNNKGITYTLKNLPRGSGLSMDRGLIFGIIRAADLAVQPLQVVIVATNDLTTCQTVLTLNIVGTVPTPAPLLCSAARNIPLQAALEDNAYSIQMRYFFQPPAPPAPAPWTMPQPYLPPEGLIYYYEVDGLPQGTGFSINSNTGLFSGTASAADIQAAGFAGLNLVTTVTCNIFSGLPVSRAWALQIQRKKSLPPSPGSGSNDGCNGGCGQPQPATTNPQQPQPPVNPCSSGNGGCAQVCRNQDGRPLCDCWVGNLQPDGRSCADPCDFGIGGGSPCDSQNPCNYNNGGCQQICSFLNGVSQCRCNQGQLGPDGKSCGGMDLCSFNNGGCGASCSVVNNQVTCGCPAVGTVLQPNGKTCAPDSKSLILIGTIPPAMALGCQFFVFDVSTAFRYTGPFPDRITYTVTGLPANTGYLLSGTSGMFKGTPTADDCAGAQPRQLTLTATDGNVHSAAVMFLASYCKIGVCDQYGPSTRSASNIPVIQAQVCAPLRFDVSPYFAQFNVDYFTLKGLPAGSGLAMSSAGVISGTPSNADCVAPLQLVAFGKFYAQPKINQAMISVHFNSCDCVQPPNSLPKVALPTSNQYTVSSSDETISLNLRAAKNEAFYYDLTANLDAWLLTHQLFFTISNLPSGFMISKSGILSGLPSATCMGFHNALVKVYVQGIDKPVSMSINVECDQDQTTNSWYRAGVPFVMGALPPVSAFLGEFLDYAVHYHFSSGSGESLNFSVVGLPSQSNLYMTEDGVLLGTPSLADAQLQTLLVVAQDSDGETASASLDIAVRTRQQEKFRPVFVPLKQQLRAFRGQPFSFNVRPRFRDQGEMQFSATGLPEGGSLAFSKNGVLSGIPNGVDALVQFFDVSITAINNINGEALAILSIEVFGSTDATELSETQDVNEYTSVVAIPVPGQVAKVGEPLVLGMKSLFHDPEAHIRSFSVYGLPAGSGLTMDGPTGILSGTPNEIDLAQPLKLFVCAIDDNGVVASETLNLRIVPSGADYGVKLKPAVSSSASQQIRPSRLPDLVIIESPNSAYAVPLLSVSYGVPIVVDFAEYFPTQLGSFVYRYSIQDLPEETGLAMSDTGFLNGAASPAAEHQYLFTVKVEQFFGERKVSEMRQQVVVSFSQNKKVNQPPSVVSRPHSVTQVANDMLLVDVSSSFSDPDEMDSLSFTIVGLPENTGLTMVKSSGILFGLPSEADIAAPQPLVLTVIAEDLQQGKAQEVMLLTLLALNTLTEESDGAASAKYCHELGWPVQHGVCYSAPTLRNKCLSAMEYQDAEAICRDLGARLCTSQELSQAQVASGKCNTGTTSVWSSSPCAFPDQFLTVSGLTQMDEPQLRQAKACFSKNSTFQVKCCADVQTYQQPKNSVVSCQNLGWAIAPPSLTKLVCATDSYANTAATNAAVAESPEDAMAHKAKATQGKVAKAKAKAKKAKAVKGKAIAKASSTPLNTAAAKATKDLCFEKMTFEEASTACLTMGARTCSAVELNQNIGALSSSCGVDQKRLWSSTTCGDGTWLLTAGGSASNRRTTAAPFECSDPKLTLAFVCCADVRQGEQFSAFSAQFETLPQNKRTARVLFSWPAFDEFRVSYKPTDAKAWLTLASQVVQKAGLAKFKMDDLSPGVEYSIRIMPLVNKNLVSDQQIVQYLYVE